VPRFTDAVTWRHLLNDDDDGDEMTMQSYLQYNTSVQLKVGNVYSGVTRKFQAYSLCHIQSSCMLLKHYNEFCTVVEVNTSGTYSCMYPLRSIVV
jgi:hypothetical protein